MNVFKTIQKLTLSTVLILALSACSNKDNNDTNTTEQTTSTTQGGGESGSTDETNDSSNDDTTTDNNTNTENNETNLVDDNATATLKSLTLTLDETTDLSLQATYSNNTSKTLSNNIEWIVSPSDAVQITDHTLTAKKDSNVTVQAKVGNILSNTISLNITWVVNGHVLPPEPDKTLNDSTLLGIDSNDNGVRDDVERYILQTYGKEEITIQIGFQVARAYNSVIEHPENAWETDKVLSAAQDCASYFSSFAEFFNEPILLDKNIVVSKKFKSIMLNTRERIKNYLLYNQKLSGGIFASTPLDELKVKCKFDVEILLKVRK